VKRVLGSGAVTSQREVLQFVCVDLAAAGSAEVRTVLAGTSEVVGTLDSDALRNRRLGFALDMFALMNLDAKAVHRHRTVEPELEQSLVRHVRRPLALVRKPVLAGRRA